MHKLDTIGNVSIFIDLASRDIVLALTTDIGTVKLAIPPERACQLGVALIRESGKRFTFKEKTNESQEITNDGSSTSSTID